MNALTTFDTPSESQCLVLSKISTVDLDFLTQLNDVSRGLDDYLRKICDSCVNGKLDLRLLKELLDLLIQLNSTCHLNGAE